MDKLILNNYFHTLSPIHKEMNINTTFTEIIYQEIKATHNQIDGSD
jgi:hypothetical protein